MRIVTTPYRRVNEEQILKFLFLLTAVSQLLVFVACLEVFKQDFHVRRPTLFLCVLFKDSVKVSITEVM
jgi:hypothetical protein